MWQYVERFKGQEHIWTTSFYSITHVISNFYKSFAMLDVSVAVCVFSTQLQVTL